MPSIISFMGILATLILVACVGYSAGYQKREHQFQDGPIVFTINESKIAEASRVVGGGIKIEIFDSQKVKVSYD